MSVALTNPGSDVDYPLAYFIVRRQSSEYLGGGDYSDVATDTIAYAGRFHESNRQRIDPTMVKPGGVFALTLHIFIVDLTGLDLHESDLLVEATLDDGGTTVTAKPNGRVEMILNVREYQNNTQIDTKAVE